MEMRLGDTTPTAIRDLWGGCMHRVTSAQYLEDVAGIMVSEIYERFQASLVMTRAFLTVPFQSLPARQKEFARELARSVALESLLKPATPVLSLVGTRGCVEEWNHVRRSHRHLALPLLSESFVGAIPMMSRLLKELGLPLTWDQGPGEVLTGQTLGSEVGFFHIEDAAVAEDELGRKIITAQEFVADYDVRSVFAVGGGIFGGAVLVFILFSRERVEARTVRMFMPLVNLLKAMMLTHCSMSRVFRPTNADAVGRPS